MNKAELIDAIAKQANFSKAAAERSLAALLDLIGKGLQSGETITLVGFGTFRVSDRAERRGRNPKTGEEILIKAAKVPSFRAGKALKDAIQ